MNPENNQAKTGLNPNAKAFVPKAKPAAAAMPTDPMAPSVPNAGIPMPGMNPEYAPYPYPPMNYYPGYPQYQDQGDYDDDYAEEEKKVVSEEKSKKKKKTEAKKEPVKKEHKKEKKKEVPKEAPKEAKKEVPKEETKKKPTGEQTNPEEEEELPSDYVAVDEKRQPLSIVFIGHVDVGKSTICGRIMILAEKVDGRTIKKYEAEAKSKGRDTWWLAYVMDCNEEERLKGKTVEVGRATFTTENKRYTIYDAPGHQNYVPNMIMGAAMADIGALVISAKTGEFESGFERGGQTLEHMLLARSLGIQKLIVIVNKMDEPLIKWSKERYEKIKSSLSPCLARYGFDPEKSVTWVPISGLTGMNIGAKMDPKQCNWYNGPTLMEILEAVEVPERDDKGAIRIPVLDKMKDRGMDIFGKVDSGRIDLGTQVMIMPYKMSAEIAMIRNTDDQLVKYAKAGENVKLRLKGLENEDLVYKGCVMCSPSDLCPVFQTFEAEVKIVNMLKHKPIISTGYQCVLHLHTLAEECTVVKLLEIRGPKDKEYKKGGKYAREEDKLKCIISTKTMIAAEKFSVRPLLGRFTLRDEGKTIAIGTILKYQPIKEGTQS